MSAILLAKPLMPSTKERVTIYVLFCNGQVQVRYWRNVRWCPTDDFSTNKVYICVSLDRTPSFKHLLVIYFLL